MAITTTKQNKEHEEKININAATNRKRRRGEGGGAPHDTRTAWSQHPSLIILKALTACIVFT